MARLQLNKTPRLANNFPNIHPQNYDYIDHGDTSKKKKVKEQCVIYKDVTFFFLHTNSDTPPINKRTPTQHTHTTGVILQRCDRITSLERQR